MLKTSGQPSHIQEDHLSESTLILSQDRAWVLSIMARANEIAYIVDLSDMLQAMLDLMMEINLANSANLFQLDPATDELVMTHVSGDAESQYLIGLRLNRQQRLPGMGLCDTKIMVVGDLPSDPDWLHAVDPVSAARKRNVINIPITNKTRTLGVIQIFNYQHAQLDLLTVLGDRLAIEIDRRKEVDSTRKSNQRLLTLVDMLGEVSRTLDRNRILHLVTENASRLVGAERSSIFLVDPNTREMIFQVAYQSQDQGPVPASGDNSNRSAGLRQPDGPGHNHSAKPNHPNNIQAGEFSYFNRSSITVPLRSEPVAIDPADDRDHVLGGLMVLNKQNASFQEEDAQLMTILANQASAFLQIAEMYESAGELFLGVIKALTTAVDAKDPSTQGHSQRVSDYSVLIARAAWAGRDIRE